MATGLALLLSGCVSLGASGDPPEALLTLSANEPLARDSARDATTSRALIVSLPKAPRSLDTNRVPVQVDDTSIAYVEQALWVDRPTRLFQSLVMETVRARTDRLVLAIEDAQSREGTILSGELVNFGYDARSGDAVVTYDAVRRERSGEVSTRRFEEREPVGNVEAAIVGQALNSAANRVAIAIANWVGD
ncbi:ABC-type transport auxiliary lipoprotein family protein [Alterisphingorhabdus coralli]|uniref:ABC-type transport auxiliary lipoprotein family protein n=1 Tax=Alterisphingorhabdus coralli TaxID=3071408 RepID=A0AA97F8U2_9SPHN|nr:ABC-type transport auxiliary lipoprotein family protein [Parasphingorhabdus sp. SCSIO 66989]WOE75162.1 ABC-type transport auxiliary lipoprotein family protein [Parasphingorhabdus sp. SCSIO 66989]